jgi:hypothetical protein
MLGAMWFVRRCDADAEWWRSIEEHPWGAPGVVRELTRERPEQAIAGRSVVCDESEARQALAWARAHPAWSDSDPALELVDSMAPTDVPAP